MPQGRRYLSGMAYAVGIVLWMPIALAADAPLPTTQPAIQTRPTGSRSAAVDPTETITLDLGGGEKIELVRIQPGEFLMGSPENEKDRHHDEGPQHRVRISKPFYMGKYEVTQGQWQAVMGSNPSSIQDPKNPVDGISWDDCQGFLAKLNAKMKGRHFRLPTEAEWEYACRAGSANGYCFGDAEPELRDYAWYGDNSDMKPHLVGQKKPNVWGLYDMHGNVWEWCQDWHGTYAEPAQTDPTGSASGSYRVLRGGVCYYNASYCRSAYRYINYPFARYSYRGVRLVLDSE